MSDLREDFMPQNNVAAPGDSNDNHLADFRAVETERGGNKGRIVAALAVVLLAGAAGVYAYNVSGGAPASKPVAASHVAMKPPAAPVQKMAAAAPAQPAQAAPQDMAAQPPMSAEPADKAADASPQQTADATPPKPVVHHRARGPMTADELQRINRKAAEEQAKADNMPASVAQLVPAGPQQMAANTPAPMATQPDQAQPDQAQQQAAQQPVTQPAVTAPSGVTPQVATNPAAPTAPQAAQQAPAPQPQPVPAVTPTPPQQPAAGPDPALATPPVQ